MNRIRFSTTSFALLAMVLVVLACEPSAPVAPAPTPTAPAATSVPTTAPVAAPTQARVPATVPPTGGLPPEPMAIKFKASDGRELQGLYYPAAAKAAPVIVLMHWAPGDQNDWPEIAFWLQNRGTGGKTPNPKKAPWLDPSWFPPMLKDQSFAVFTFTFRGCDGGCRTFDRAAWLLDAQAAMQAAGELKGIDPQRILSAGASIGADGAPDGCFWLNAQAGKGRCLGAFSFSPGDYLTVPYADAVKKLEADKPPKPVWCLYGEGDAESSKACKSASGNVYRAVSYKGNAHGMALVIPKLEPNALQLFLDWLQLSLKL